MEDSIKALLESYEADGGINQVETHNLPAQEEISSLLRTIKGILFPGYFAQGPVSTASLTKLTTEAVHDLSKRLKKEVLKSFNVCETTSFTEEERLQKTDEIVKGFIAELPQIRRKLKLDRDAIYAGDPAAKSDAEIILSYPGFHAIMVFRIATYFFYQSVPLIPRIMTEIAHSKTGIDIHPGAKIGSHFCIDHGTGVVIGESSVIGNHVKLYQGVTLGALSVKDRDCEGQRHPTIEDHVTVYSGTTILGGETVIGHHSIIGGNVWLTTSVAPHGKVYIHADQKQAQVERPGKSS